MLLCLSFVIMRCTATFAILCLAVLILLEHAQTCFEGPLPKKKTVSYQDYQGLSVEITCWLPFCATEKTHSTVNSWASCCSDAFNNNLVQRCFRKAFGICNDAVLCGVAVEYWRGIVDVDGFLCCVQLKSPHLSAMACKKLGGFLECSWPCFARLLHFALQGASFFFCLFCSRLHGIPEATWLAACYLKTI